MGIGAFRHLVTIEDPRHPLPIAPIRVRRPVAVTSVFPTTGLVSYWKLDEASGTRVDSVGTNHLTPTNAPVGAPGKIGNACDFEADSVQYLSHPDPTPLGDEDFTYTTWFKRESLGNNSVVLGKDGGTGRYYYFIINSAGGVAFTLHGGAVATNGSSPNDTNWHFAAFWHDAAINTIFHQIDNGPVASSTYGTYTPPSGSTPVRFGQDGFSSKYFDGLIDEVGLWRRVLTPAERTTLYNGGAGLTFPTGTAPIITTQPQSSSIASGASVTLTVVADGPAPLAYQWAKDGVDIPGATSATYDTGPVTETTVYDVTVTNAFGTVTSAPATVTVLPPVVYAPTWYCSLQSAAAQVIDGQAAFFVKGRYHPAITLETQLIFEGRRLQVQSISDVDERHVELVLMCVEVVARGRESATH